MRSVIAAGLTALALTRAAHAQQEQARYDFPAVIGGQEHILTYDGTHDLVRGADPNVKLVVFVHHGGSQNPTTYFDRMRAALDAADADRPELALERMTMIVAPAMIGADHIAENPRRYINGHYPYWDGGWREGADSENSPEVSNYDLLDAMVLHIAKRFRGVKAVVHAGHSAGGQLVSRYSVGTAVYDSLQANGIHVRYVIANPSSVLYLDKQRPDLAAVNGFVDYGRRTPTVAGEECAEFNAYKYGFDGLVPYMTRRPVAEMIEGFRQREVYLLLGLEDNDPDGEGVDQDCPGRLQGRHRLERGRRYYEYLGHFFGPDIYRTKFIELVPGVGHHSGRMFLSPEAQSILFFDADSAADAIATANADGPAGSSSGSVAGPVVATAELPGHSAARPFHSAPGAASSTAVAGNGSSRTGTGVQAVDTALFTGLRYRNIGPHRGGRVTAVAGHTTRPGTFFMGATGGGVWKTESYGNVWRNVSDGFFATGSIGAIDVADSNPDAVYVGTGSAAIRSNVITGRGVYRSDDEGHSWSFVGLREAGQIGAIDIDPRDPDVVFVAAVGNIFAPNPERGVFRTRDGGRHWEKLLFLSDSTGASDVRINPINPEEIWAGMWRAERKPWTIISGAGEGGVYRSRDGGDTWEEVTNGLPTGLTGKIAIDIARSDPRRMYVMIEAPGSEGGLYRSDDGGASWHLVNSSDDIRHRSFYYTYVWVDPTDADVVYTGAEEFFRSADGGISFDKIPTPHNDNHDLWINPENPLIMIQGNDGGANVTLDGGRTWSTQFNQPTAEIYQVAVDDRFPYRVYGAQQDNTTVIVPNLYPFAERRDPPMRIWQQGPGCETGPIVPHPEYPEIVYGACKGRFSRLDLRTGQEGERSVGARDMYGHDTKDLKYRFQRVSPLVVSQHDPRVIYHASQYVHRTRDEGLTWERMSPDLTANEPERQMASGEPISRDITGEEFYSTLYELTESPHDANVLWAGANDGPIHLTRNGGRSWVDVTPRDLPPGGRVQTIEVSPHDPARAYVAVLRYMLGDRSPHIYRTDDYGRTWTRLTTGDNGIPNGHPTRVVREDPEREGLLYAGTEFGMYVSFSDGTSWQPFQLNLPVVPVTDMVVHRGDLVISTMGRSFWIFDDLSPLREIMSGVDVATPYLVAPRPAYRMRYHQFDDRPDAPRYPPPGALIHYYLPSDTEDVELEISTSDGRTIRAFAPDAGSRLAAARPVKTLAGDLGARPALPSLETGRGMHRFVWDLRHLGSWSPDLESNSEDGPLAVPGVYNVRLTVGDWSETVPLRILIDPRLEAGGTTQADLEAQFDLSQAVVHLLSEARMMAASIEEQRDKLDAGPARQVDEIHRMLVDAPGKYPQRMLISQLEYLYEVITTSDLRPNRDAFDRFEELRAELEGYTAAAQRILDAGMSSDDRGRSRHNPSIGGR